MPCLPCWLWPVLCLTVRWLGWLLILKPQVVLRSDCIGREPPIGKTSHKAAMQRWLSDGSSSNPSASRTGNEDLALPLNEKCRRRLAGLFFPD